MKERFFVFNDMSVFHFITVSTESALSSALGFQILLDVARSRRVFYT
jgi:hypothetical protein